MCQKLSGSATVLTEPVEKATVVVSATEKHTKGSTKQQTKCLEDFFNDEEEDCEVEETEEKKNEKEAVQENRHNEDTEYAAKHASRTKRCREQMQGERKEDSNKRSRVGRSRKQTSFLRY